MTRRGAADTITEECERLFCGTLRTVFMGEMMPFGQDSLVMGAHIHDVNTGMDDKVNARMVPQRTRGMSFASASSYSSHGSEMQAAVMQGLGTPSSIMSNEPDPSIAAAASIGPDSRLVRQYLELWDYKGGASFKGFVTADKTMVVFFDDGVISKELKPGYVPKIQICRT